MGDYITRAEVLIAAGGESHLIQLADLDGDGKEDEGVVDAAIADAEALINSYARKVFEVPFAPTVPPIIIAVAKRLTIYVLKQNRAMVTESERLEHEDRLAWLSDLARGKVDPGISPAPAGSGHNRSTSTPRPTSRQASRESLKGFA